MDQLDINNVMDHSESSEKISYGVQDTFVQNFQAMCDLEELYKHRLKESIKRKLQDFAYYRSKNKFYADLYDYQPNNFNIFQVDFLQNFVSKVESYLNSSLIEEKQLQFIDLFLSALHMNPELWTN